MKTKKLSLEAYAALGIALLSQTNADAQVVIKDFDPDLRMMNWSEDGSMGDTITIDIDENGIDDIIFVYTENYGEADLIVYKNDAVTNLLIKDNDTPIYAFSFGDEINGSIIFSDSELLMYHASRYFSITSGLISSYFGAFKNDNYLGLQINIDGNIHFGWARVSVQTLADDDNANFRYSGSPLTVYEIAYEQTPVESIICDAGTIPETNTIGDVILTDDIDVNDISDLLLSFEVYAEPDFSELRFYLISSREDVINFSVEDALALTEERYLVIPADSLIVGEDFEMRLPIGLLDINGNPFSPDNYYSAFYMKIPVEGDSSILSLSAPFNVVKTVLQHCSLNASPIEMEFLYGEAAFHISFENDYSDEDIGEYGAGVAKDGAVPDWTYYGVDYTELDTVGIIHIPKTGDSVYELTLTGLTKDIFGNDLEPLYEYNPVIFGFGDAYFRDLMCFDYENIDVIYNVGIIEIGHKGYKIQQSNVFYFETQIQNFTIGSFILELRTITGELLITEKIISEIQTFSFPSLPDGVYIATIKENDVPVLVAKVILQK